MSDRELLEMAAKAVGMLGNTTGEIIDPTWNPLTSDRDALRLAVKLNINPQQYPIYLQEKHSVIAVMHIDIENDISGIATYDECGGDKFAATRLAIVRAAAEIGKETP